MKKKLFWMAGFFVLLVTAFYFFLFSGTDYYKAKLPVLASVPGFSFTGQNGKEINHVQCRRESVCIRIFFYNL